MENEFKEVMSQRTDEELIEIVTIEKENYKPIAIEAAEVEITKRKIDVRKYEDEKEKAIVKKKQEDKVDSKVVSLRIRFLNFLIDILVWLVLSFMVSFIVGLFMFPTNQYFYSILIFGTFIGYFAVMEIKFQKTVGKFITKTKVVKINGEKPENSDIIARTFCRLIPFDRLSFLFFKNGIHDILSKTKVIRDNPDV